jgi:hypothetical protein
MAYEISSWTRCTSGGGEVIHGEEQLRLVRVRHFGQTTKVLAMLRSDWSVCRVTLSRPGSESVWDLHRGEGRDTQLDSSMRATDQTTGVESRVMLDVGPGITQAQLAEAVEALVTRLASSSNS